MTTSEFRQVLSRHAHGVDNLDDEQVEAWRIEAERTIPKEDWFWVGPKRPQYVFSRKATA